MATERSYVNFRIKEYRGSIVSEVCALLAQIYDFKHAQYQFFFIYMMRKPVYDILTRKSTKRTGFHITHTRSNKSYVEISA